MTDRELLEMAAKAAGLHIVPCTCRNPKWPFAHDEKKSGKYGHWNPLTDDGDALRLAVQTGEPFVVRTRCVTTMSGLKEDYDPFVPGDDLRATRRAIVRAAAEIGKAMP